MKYLLSFIFLIGVAYGQTPTYTPMKSFYEFKGIKMDSLFLLPSFADTTAANTGRIKSIVGSMIKAGNDVYMRYNNKWNGIGVVSQNFANTNLTFSSNRSHDMNNYGMTIDRANYITLISRISPGNPTSVFAIDTSYATLYSRGLTDTIGLLFNNINGTGNFYGDNGNKLWIPSTIHTQNDTIATRAYSRSAGGTTIDTTSLSNRINLRIDSLRRSNDSIFARKNNAWVYQYKNAAIPPDAPERIKGTANGSVSANMNGYDFILEGANYLKLHAQGDSSALEVFGSEVTLGDVFNTGSQVKLYMDTEIPKASISALSTDMGLSLDFDNNEYYIGDLNSNAFLKINANDDSTTIVSGAINLASNKIYMDDTSNKPVGSGTFSAGVATINNTTVTANSKIFITYTNCVNCATAYIDSITAGASFVVKSNDSSDDSNFDYLIIN